MNNDADLIIRPYSQANLDYAHGEALKEDAERAAEVVTVTQAGTIITRGMLDEEMRAGRINARRAWALRGPNPWIVGVNASSNMFA